MKISYWALVGFAFHLQAGEITRAFWKKSYNILYPKLTRGSEFKKGVLIYSCWTDKITYCLCTLLSSLWLAVLLPLSTEDGLNNRNSSWSAIPAPHQESWARESDWTLSSRHHPHVILCLPHTTRKINWIEGCISFSFLQPIKVL